MSNQFVSALPRLHKWVSAVLSLDLGNRLELSNISSECSGKASDARRIWVFAGLVVVSVLLWARPLLQLFRLAWNSEPYSHILLILPASLCLLALEYGKREPSTTSWLPGSVLLLLAGGIAIGGAYLAAPVTLFFQIVALVTFWIAACVLCFGWQSSRAFPLLFLFFLAPLPSPVMEKIIFFLQYGSTQVAYLFLRLFNVPVIKSGFVLSLPTLNIEVARECSGIRSSITLLATTIVLSYLCLRSRWRQVVVCTCVLPLAVIKNGLRVFVLSALATYEDPSWLDGRLHHNGGFLFFALALAVVIAVIVRFYRSEQEAVP